MIKLKQLISEVIRLNSIKEIEPIRNELAAVAQEEYDNWIQDEEDHNEELGSGGICHLIAEKLVDVLSWSSQKTHLLPADGMNATHKYN